MGIKSMKNPIVNTLMLMSLIVLACCNLKITTNSQESLSSNFLQESENLNEETNVSFLQTQTQTNRKKWKCKTKEECKRICKKKKKPVSCRKHCRKHNEKNGCKVNAQRCKNENKKCKKYSGNKQGRCRRKVRKW